MFDSPKQCFLFCLVVSFLAFREYFTSINNNSKYFLENWKRMLFFLHISLIQLLLLLLDFRSSFKQFVFASRWKIYFSTMFTNSMKFCIFSKDIEYIKFWNFTIYFLKGLSIFGISLRPINCISSFFICIYFLSVLH